YADAPARLQAFRTTATALGGRLSAQVIPSAVWGKTYVWDVTSHAYAEDPSPAVAGPSSGVRLILYTIDPITHHVVENPLTTVDFTYTYAGETVHLTGTVSVVQLVSVTADVAVYENGGTAPVAVIRGTADATHNGITITHQDGTQLSPAELAALDQLFQLPDQLEEALEQLFHPAERFMGI